VRIFTRVRTGKAIFELTPIPTLFPVIMPGGEIKSKPAVTSDKCRVAAADLIGAWVSAHSPEKDTFQFVNVDGEIVRWLFVAVIPYKISYST
jgi:hypothetical protein